MRYLPVAIFLLGLIAQAAGAPSVHDATLIVDPIIHDLEESTGMAFMPNGKAFVLEQHTGKVRILDGRNLAANDVLDLKVADSSEEGLLSIALHPNFSSNGFVYLYYTEARDFDGGIPIANRIDRFHWDGSKLTFDRRIKSLPAFPGLNHNGGKILFGPDNKLYSVTGDLNRFERTENYERSSKLSRSAVILRLNDNGKAPTDNPFYNVNNRGSKAVLNEIYAYGIRNSFGMDFDPVTHHLWDTENGVDQWDEINRLRPGYNSGWADIMGPKARATGTNFTLTKLGRRARYIDPQLSWRTVVAPTDLEFFKFNTMNDSRLNDLFVGDLSGNLYDLNLSSTRRALALTGSLADKVVDNGAEDNDIILGTGFGIITDLVSRPDGLYVMSLDGDIYRIATLGVPGPPPASTLTSTAVPEPSSIALLSLVAVFGLHRPARRQRF
ncbi:MAG TPA: PQQ-dependent sugar dehydrogenase [Tepidisphaeraceae bacterium]|jgi:glucose/arabinose dehydrogenase|nr:PQQ-dependent sugar dehydrogenase [Tepidisphaeraceae bacterium]